MFCRWLHRLGRAGREQSRRDALRLPWRQAVFWALDIETSGLDANRDRILSIGMVPIRAGAIRVGEAWSSFAGAEVDRDTGHGGVHVHQILPAETDAAPHLAEVLASALSRLREPGAVLLVHVAAFDVPFLARACQGVGVRWPVVPVVDTAKLLDHWMPRERREATWGKGHARLDVARRIAGLPPTMAHEALSDALATAELFLVLAQRLNATSVRSLVLAS
jgi:DNA polymerase-3 subunit epsilon